MSEMVFIGISAGSKVVVVACPKCGRISRQILRDAYAQQSSCALSASHKCPVCGITYSSCSSAQSSIWVAAYNQFKRDEQGYNVLVKDRYQNPLHIIDKHADLSELVFLGGKLGIREVTVACPKCGRISMAVLHDTYVPDQSTYTLSKTHSCRLCGNEYYAVSLMQQSDWKEAYNRYLKNPVNYNLMVNKDYKRRLTTTTPIQSVPTPAPIVPQSSTTTEVQQAQGALLSTLQRRLKEKNRTRTPLWMLPPCRRSAMPSLCLP